MIITFLNTTCRSHKIVLSLIQFISIIHSTICETRDGSEKVKL